MMKVVFYDNGKFTEYTCHKKFESRVRRFLFEISLRSIEIDAVEFDEKICETIK